MKFQKYLCLLALISMMYGCSNNIMNDEDPAATLKAEQSPFNPNSTEFIKSEHIAGYLDGRVEILYIMPDYQEVTLQRLGVANLGANRYEISTAHAEGVVTRQQFSIVNMKEQAMIYKLSSVRDYESTNTVLTDDPNHDPIPIGGDDCIIYIDAKCKPKGTANFIPCHNWGIGSMVVSKYAYSTCQAGFDICIEWPKVVRKVTDYVLPDCVGDFVVHRQEKMACD